MRNAASFTMRHVVIIPVHDDCRFLQKLLFSKKGKFRDHFNILKVASNIV